MAENTKKRIHLLLIIGFLNLAATSPMFAQRGKDGAISISTAGTILNEYTTLASNANAGSITLAVANSSLNTNGHFSSSLSPGDLIMIIQMQGASIQGTPSGNTALPADSTWGNITGYNNCGNYEFAQVLTIPGSTSITLDCPLKYNYTATGHVQVIRIPRLASLTINAGGELTCDPWNGSVGGIAVTEVQGNTAINAGGKMDVSGKGFRGGQADQLTAYNLPQLSASTLPDNGGEKGESIAGYQSDYTPFGGMYGRGAAANGGGGGNAHNSGGGGGGNGGIITQWTGHGMPDITNSSWINAWNLQYAGFSAQTSEGGGQGGYAFSILDLDATLIAPGNWTWTGDNRSACGGFGGRPLDYSTGKIFLGGGGGAGDQNDNAGGTGGNGGGIIYIISYGNISGTGQIISNGSAGGSTTGLGNDGSGGGGAGGTILLSSTGNISGINCIADGGAGGNQNVVIVPQTEAEGPGGGGSGGYIAFSSGTPALQTNPGAYGTTNSTGLTEFNCNGATSGAGGITGTVPPPIVIATTGDTICSGQSGTVSAGPGTNITWYSVPTGGNSIGSGASYTSPPLFSNTTYYAEVCPGTYRDSVEVIVTPPPSASFSATTVCFNNPTVFTDLSTGNPTQWNWDFGDGNVSTSQHPSHNYNSAGTYSVTLIIANASGCSDTFKLNVVVNPLPVSNFSSTTVCSGSQTCFTDLSSVVTGSISSWSWNFGDPASGGNNTSNQQNPCHIYSSSGNFNVIITVTSNNGCQNTVNLPAIVTPPTAASFTFSNGCQNTATNFTDGSVGATVWSWNFGDGGISSTQNPTHTYLSFGTFTVTLIAGTAGSCVDTAVNFITIYPPPTPKFTADTVCLGNPTSFSDLSFIPSGTLVLWSWTFDDGTNSTQQNPTHIFTTSGIHSATLTVTSNNGCTATISHGIYVNDFPTAAFTTSPGTGGDILEAIQFNDQSTGSIVTWSWNFGDGNTSTLQNPSHLYSNIGTYTVTLIVETAYGCRDTVLQLVEIKEYSFYIPNAFTPNEDGTNDFFFGQGIGITSYELWIFDRWGNLIFHCNINDLPQSQPCQWNGKDQKGNSDKVVQEDVYVWKVMYTNIFNREITNAGIVTIVK